MRFTDLLSPEVISIGPSWSSFEETIDGLVASLAGTGALEEDTSLAARTALRSREATSSTAILEIGVGVPHARLAGLGGPLVALAVGASGLYEAAPTVPIRIVALVLSPERTTDEHLRLLGGIATALRSSALREALLRAPTPETALGVLHTYL
jgi:mannitol/fructose-specific phosphotransferase system IIA component (Ntr-type)